jgi:hypothetical protein
MPSSPDYIVPRLPFRPNPSMSKNVPKPDDKFGFSIYFKMKGELIKITCPDMATLLYRVETTLIDFIIRV